MKASEKIADMNQNLKPVIEGIHESIKFDNGKLTIQLQVGHPNEEGAVKGCFPTHAVESLIALHEYYQNQIRSRETALVITKLQEARLWQEWRKMDREKRGVLQTDNK